MSNEKTQSQIQPNREDFEVYTCTPISLIRLEQAYNFWKEDPKSVDGERAKRFARIAAEPKFEAQLYKLAALAKEGIAPTVNFKTVCPHGTPVLSEGTLFWTYDCVCWARRWWNGGAFSVRMDASNES
jgi:hypothetical protein